VFTVITHLEMLMADLIRRRCPKGDWLPRLNSKRRSRIELAFKKSREQDCEIDRLAVTSFGDKGRVIISLGILSEEFPEQLGGLEGLRNKLAHADEFAPDKVGMEKFISSYKNACYWVQQIHKELDEEEANRSRVAVGS